MGLKYFKIIILAIKTFIKRFKKTKINIFRKLKVKAMLPATLR
jgi:hypothetical protein